MPVRDISLMPKGAITSRAVSGASMSVPKVWSIPVETDEFAPHLGRHLDVIA